MTALSPEPNVGAGRAALAGLALVLIVIVASAALRIVGALPPQPEVVVLVRVIHRASASLAVIAVLVLCILCWRQPALRFAALVALGVTLALSALGASTGIAPPPPAVFGNLAGGLILAGLLARLQGRACPANFQNGDAPLLRALTRTGLLFAAVQVAIGAWLAATGVSPGLTALSVHAACGLAAAAVSAGVGLELRAAGLRRDGAAIMALAMLIPLAGAWSALAAPLIGVVLAHPLLVALNIAALSRALGRLRAA